MGRKCCSYFLLLLNIFHLNMCARTNFVKLFCCSPNCLGFVFFVALFEIQWKFVFKTFYAVSIIIIINHYGVNFWFINHLSLRWFTCLTDTRYSFFFFLFTYTLLSFSFDKTNDLRTLKKVTKTTRGMRTKNNTKET